MKFLAISMTFSLIFFAPSLFAEGGEKSSGVSTQHIPHPPHDHHNDDHIKKLDESLKRSREEESEHDSED